jgi:hypothetical protein
LLDLPLPVLLTGKEIIVSYLRITTEFPVSLYRGISLDETCSLMKVT